MQAICSNCKGPNLVTNSFCGNCGAPLEPVKAEPEAKAKPTRVVEAESDLEQAEAKPTNLVEAERHLQQADAFEEAYEYERALKECDAAIRLWPALASAHNLRGVVLEELGREKEAVLDYRETLRLDPGFDAAAENLQACEAELVEAQAQSATERVERPAQPIVDEPTEPPAKPETHRIAQPPEPLTEEPTEPPAIWVRILTAPLVAYMFLGTGLLFLVSKTETLAEALANRYGDSGLRGVKAREWHAREMWLPVAFPVTFPVLGIRALLMLFFAAAYVAGHLPLEGWKVVRALLRRAAVWLAGLIVAALRWIARPVRAGWAWIVAAFDATWAWLVSLIVAAWRWIARPIRAVWRWSVALIRQAWAWIVSTLRRAWSWITRPSRANWDWLTVPLRSGRAWVAKSVRGSWNAVIKPVRAGWGQVAAGTRAAWDSVAGSARSMQSWTRESMRASWD